MTRFTFDQAVEAIAARIVAESLNDEPFLGEVVPVDLEDARGAATLVLQAVMKYPISAASVAHAFTEFVDDCWPDDGIEAPIRVERDMRLSALDLALQRAEHFLLKTRVNWPLGVREAEAHIAALKAIIAEHM